MTGGNGGAGGQGYKIPGGRIGGGGGGGAGGDGARADADPSTTISVGSDIRLTGGSGGRGYGNIYGDGGGGGAGLSFSGGTVVNDGVIAGGVGGNSGNGTAGAGGSGLNFFGSVVDNAGTILGGDGGSVTGGAGGAHGGRGGAGLSFTGDTMTNTSLIAGGNGGGFSGDSTRGGAGGAGVSFEGTAMTNMGTISGGSGGGAFNEYADGAGGDGGIGVRVDGAGDVTNLDTINGGNGGDGGAGGFPSANSDGGLGGAGISMGSGMLTNSATIAGGAGGNGGSPRLSYETPGAGGAGGAGVSGTGTTIVNRGSIAGGQGGMRGTGGDEDKVDGEGGAGIVGSDLVIVNSGGIVGGFSGHSDPADQVRANAITFTGGQNRLEIHAGSAITGIVDATGDTDSTFALGGVANGSFDVSQLGGSAQYRGFEHFEKTGTGTWTLTGASTLDWKITAGGLSTAAERFSGNADIAGGASLIFDQAVNASYWGALSGAGQFIKVGAGTLFHNGDSAGFTGNTIIEDGALVVGSDAAHVDAALGGSFKVEDGGVLGGNGMLGSGAGSTVTISSGGTIAPGNSIGTMTVNGNYTQLTGSTYMAEIAPDGASDLIDVTGNATIEGGTVFALKAPGGYSAGTRYTILTAAGGVTGMYDTLDQNAPFVDLALVYDPGAVHLDVMRNQVAFCDVAATFNQCSTGDGAESLGAGNPLYDAIAGLPDEVSARHALNQLSGEIHASARSALIEESHFVRDAVNDRIQSAFGDLSAASLPVMAYGPGGPQPVAPGSFGPVAWGHAFGTWGSFDGDGNASGLDISTGGFLTGIDGEIASNVRLGVLAGYSHSSFDIDGGGSSGDSDNYHVGLYAGGKWNALRLSGGLAYTWHDIETSRSVAFAGFSDSVTGDYSAGTVQAFGEAGYRVEVGAVSVEPFASLAYVGLHTNAFAENGGAAALDVRSETMDTAFTTLGIHLSSAFDLNGMKTTAHGSFGWRHAFGDTTPFAGHSFAGGDPFAIAGASIAEDAAIIDVGLDFDLTDNAALGVAYRGQIASSAQQHGFEGKLNVRF